MTTTTDALPVDWDEWQATWALWARRHARDLHRTSYRFPERNFLADEVIGVWRINGRNVELSAVTFPDLSNPRSYERKRYIGVTYGEAGGGQEGRHGTIAGPLCESFAALEAELGIR